MSTVEIEKPLDREATRKKYLAERDKRLRADGNAQYKRLEGELLKDPYTPLKKREPKTDHVTFAFIGGGFAGLVTGARLVEAGIKDVRIIEKAGDFGGTWYWNRYPGVACDVESYSYLPLLEETGYIPSMKFASGFEILEYCQKLAEFVGLYERCLFNTTVTSTTWDEESGDWTVRTDRGDAMRARFVILANGILTTPKLARIAGMETFQGESFHTSRWNYDIDLKGKRVGIIGTGATAVQAIPELAKIAGELYVFQRTPSSIDVRDQRETTDEERETWPHEPGWARARRARFAKISAGRTAMKANDDYLSGKVQEFKPARQYERMLSAEEYMEKLLDSNYRIMEQIRARVDAIVKDPKTAAALKPFYPYGCKRPTFHDEFLPTFNLPHVHLVDTAPTGVREINARGVVHDGVEYPLDVIIYATGFQWMATSTFNMISGRDGRTLTQKWKDEGVKTFLGLHSAGFPNLFVISGPQGGGGSFNFTDVIEEHANYVTWMLTTMRDRGATRVDVSQQAEDEFARHCAEVDTASAALRNCYTYYNGEGQAAPGSLAYYGGRQWNKRVAAAQSSLEPYIFG